jgi:hypothetical protein
VGRSAREAEKHAQRVKLVVRVCPVTKDLYGYATPVLDEDATLCGVESLLRYGMCPAARDVASSVIRERFESLRASWGVQ